jgi:hypothetical protein
MGFAELVIRPATSGRTRWLNASYEPTRRTMIARPFAFAALFCIIAASNGYPCSRDPNTPAPTPEELFAQAATVFVAHVIKVQEMTGSDLEKHKTVQATFRAIEKLKGSPPSSSYVLSDMYSYGNCTLPLLAGADYIFFMKDDNDHINSLEGSAGPILNLHATQVQGLLEKLRAQAK